MTNSSLVYYLTATAELIGLGIAATTDPHGPHGVGHEERRATVPGKPT